MLILNHKILEKLEILEAKNIEQIQNSLPKVFLVLRDLQLAKYCFENAIPYNAFVENSTKALFFVNLGVKNLITKDLDFAKELQDLAEKYLFDCKILLAIKEENAIKKAAKCGIDGVIFWGK